MADSLINPISGTPYEERLNKAKSAAGTNASNPEAIRQALAKDTYANDAQLKEAQGGQQNAIIELAKADQQIAQSFRNPQGQATQTFSVAPTPSAAFDPNNPQATIAGGPMVSPTVTADQQQFAYNPFVEEGLKAGQTNAATGTFTLADMARSARERYLGSEIDQIVSLYKTQIEEENKRKAEEEAKKLAEFTRQQKYAETMGGTVTDPTTGQVYKYLTPQEKAAQEQANKNTVLSGLQQKIGRTGKNLIDEVTDGQGNFSDILKENAGKLSQDEVYELARVNAETFGAFHENADQLRAMGLAPEILDKLGIPRVGGGTNNTDVSGYVNLVKSGQMKIDNVPTEVRTLVANQLSQQGGIKATSVTPEQQKARDEISSLAQEILGKGTKGLTGAMRLGLLNPFSQDLRTQKAKIEQLKSKLSLLEAAATKGQGTLSDSERAMIAAAATSLSYDQPDEMFRKEIERIQNQFGDQYAAARSQLQSGEVLVRDKSGQVGAVPESEAANYERL